MNIQNNFINYCKEGNLMLVKACLIQNVNADDDYAIASASNNGYLEVVKELIKAGADVNADNGWAIIWASDNGHTKIVNLLKEHGVVL